MEEIRYIVGDRIVNLIHTMQVYRGGDIKITPRVSTRTTLVNYNTQLKKQIQLVEFRGVVYLVVVYRLDIRDTTNEIVE